MKLTAPRILGAIAALDVVCFLVSGIFRNADEGIGEIVGGIGWFGFLGLTLVAIVMAVGLLVGSVRRTHARRSH